MEGAQEGPLLCTGAQVGATRETEAQTGQAKPKVAEETAPLYAAYCCQRPVLPTLGDYALKPYARINISML